MNKITVLSAGAVLLGMAGTVNAALLTIGTANYLGSDYNLIWDDDNNGNSIVWLDYSNNDSWDNQTNWVSGLGAELTVTMNSGYTSNIDWTTGWRLPDTVDGPLVSGVDGTTTAGYNITTSEMGHLFYEELGNLGIRDTSGNTQTGYGLQNTGDFSNLIASSYDDYYWSNTVVSDFPTRAWVFGMYYGLQHQLEMPGQNYGLAVHTGQVSAIPVPSSVWLLASGLVGLAGYARRKKT